jgi:acyl-CoA synthetase (AMP-forming)/AMP-acid ligase II
MNVAQTILSRGEEKAEAVRHRDCALAYGELRRQTDALARGLLARGAAKGDRIGIFAENGLFFVTAYLGILKAGLVAVPFLPETGASTFARVVASAGLKTILVSKRLLGRVKSWAEETGVICLDENWSAGFDGAPGIGFPDIDPQRDLAALMFTSGSTGEPKGVMVTHRNIECNTLDIVSYLGLSSQDRVMAVLPFQYCFGLSLLHTHLLAGGSLVVNNEFRLYPEAVATEIQRLACTGLAGVPSIYQILLRRSRLKKLDLPNLRWFQQAGGKLPNACIQEIVEAFPQARFFLMYGQTEATARLSYLPPERLSDKLGSIGKGLASTRLEVRHPDGRLLTPGSAETGEIWAFGDNITLGYWQDPVETARFFQNGGLRTGDLARVDDDGFIYIVDRDREMIKSGGNRISPKEVEEAIAELPEVVEVAVVGLPHEWLGECIKAVVVPASEHALSKQEVLAHCRKRLPAYKVPEEIIFTPRLIHNSAGKVLKPDLRRWLEQRDGERARTPHLQPL